MDYVLEVKQNERMTMSGDKITISLDEVNRATPVPGSTPPPILTSGYVPPESDQEGKPSRTGLFIGIGIAAVGLLCITGIGVMAIVGGDNGSEQDSHKIFSSKVRTVADYRAETMRDVEAELSKPDSKLKKRIEDAHLTVTVKSTSVVRCDVTTVDGSDRVGKDDSNIAKVSLLIRFNWEGIIDRGYTDLQIVYDVRNDRLEKSEIDHTTALVNVEDPTFWYGVGTIISSLL